VATNKGQRKRFVCGSGQAIAYLGVSLAFSSAACEGTRRIYGRELGPVDSGAAPTVEGTSPALLPNGSQTSDPSRTGEAQPSISDRANNPPAVTPLSPPVVPESQLCQGNQEPDGSCLSDAGSDPNATSGCQVDDDCSAFEGANTCTGGAAGRCVQCTDDTDCTANPSGAVCNLNAEGGTAPTNTCVECVSSNNCPNPQASRCVANRCQACSEDADCSHVVGGNTTLGVCETARTAPACVQCTGSKRGACNGGANACDGLSKQCTSLPVGTAARCATCVSDAHCATTERCARQIFAGADLGYFCFPLAQTQTCPPVFAALTTAATIDGEAADLCLLRQTTCAALDDFFQVQVCSTNADCGAVGLNLNDGRCNATLGMCNIPCARGSECPSGLPASCQDGACL
jgi:hypothetical protein